MNGLERDDGAETTLSGLARPRLAYPLFHANWLRAVFLHYEVEREELQRCVPFELDLSNGSAYVSLVAFTFADLRTGIFPALGQFLLKPISDHNFLNVRTYVRAGGETGIYFLAEWLNNRLTTPLGPPLFGLPYHFGRLDYRHGPGLGQIDGEVVGGRGRLAYSATFDSSQKPTPCSRGSLDEFLLERYTAFTQWRGVRRYFHVWHPPWPVIALPARIEDGSLLKQTGPWIQHSQFIGAHYSPGVADVRMGPPHFLKENV